MIWQGELLHIHVAPTASAAMEELREAILVGGVGIEGDRYVMRARRIDANNFIT
jgi:hypothetical protein